MAVRVDPDSAAAAAGDTRARLFNERDGGEPRPHERARARHPPNVSVKTVPPPPPTRQRRQRRRRLLLLPAAADSPDKQQLRVRFRGGGGSYSRRVMPASKVKTRRRDAVNNYRIIKLCTIQREGELRAESPDRRTFVAAGVARPAVAATAAGTRARARAH